MANLSTIDVLIIEDDPDISAIAKEYLESMNCFRHIIEANDGMIATQKLQKQKFGLIILDMNMPKKNGLDLISEFEPAPGTSTAAMNKKENVLVISGTLDRGLIAKVIQRGVKNFLIKPYDELAFKEKVSKMIA